MSQREHRQDNLGHLISDMECDVADLLRWAGVVYSLGSSDVVEPAGLQVVANAMEQTAKRVWDTWDAAFRLSHHLRRVAE